MTSNDQPGALMPSLLNGMEPPVPPPELRELALRPAVQALQRPAVPDLWTRLWQSRPLRLAWAGCTTLLLLGHLVVTLLQAKPITSQPPGRLFAHSPSDPELAEIVELPRLRTVRQPRAGIGIGTSLELEKILTTNNKVTNEVASA